MIDALRAQIERIEPVDEREAASLAMTLDRLTWPGDPFSETEHGHHVTASAFVVSTRGVILHRHRRLGIWVQPGGHIDAGESPDDACLRARRGGDRTRGPSPRPRRALFHVDVHAGPNAHTHYDLRYVLIAAPDDPEPPEGESQDVSGSTSFSHRTRGTGPGASAREARRVSARLGRERLTTSAERTLRLMEADRWIERVRAQKTHLPESAELATLEAELRALLGELRAAEGEIAPLATQRDLTAAESLRLSKRARDLDAALSSSTASARELSALQGELTHVRQLLEASEDRELELLVELEPREARLEGIKHSAQPGVSRRAELQAMIKDLQVSLDEELAALATTRDETAEAVPPELRSRYRAALARSGGSGAAQVIDGRCDGCRIALAPLDFDRFRALLEDTFMDCPECGRLLLP